MSTIWDQGVRTVERALPIELQRTDDLNGYYCGGTGSDSFCDHLSCRVVAQLEGDGLLGWKTYLEPENPEPHVPDPVALARHEDGQVPF